MSNPSNSDLVGETRLEIGLRKLRDYRGGAVLSDSEADAVVALAQQLEQAEQRIRERDERIVHYIDAKRESEEMLHARAERYREALERLVAGLETNSEAGAPDYAHAALTHDEGADPGGR